MSMYKSVFKPMADVILSLAGFIVLSPLFLLLTLLLLIVNDGSPFFLQARPGKKNRIFRLIKFKTMNDRTDTSGNLLPDKDRMTKVGRFIRSTSLDEIPQLLNVMKGDMSLIGPRPLLEDYLPLYSEEQARRHEVRPGITGWAQVHGRNTISWQKKFEYDVWYVDHISFRLDLKILLLTVSKVLRTDGINATTDITMERFR